MNTTQKISANDTTITEYCELYRQAKSIEDRMEELRPSMINRLEVSDVEYVFPDDFALTLSLGTATRRTGVSLETAMKVTKMSAEELAPYFMSMDLKKMDAGVLIGKFTQKVAAKLFTSKTSQKIYTNLKPKS